MLSSMSESKHSVSDTRGPHPEILAKLQHPPHPKKVQMVETFPVIKDLQPSLLRHLVKLNACSVPFLNETLALLAITCDSVASLERLIGQHIEQIRMLRTMNRIHIKKWCRLHHPRDKYIFNRHKFMINTRFTSWLKPLEYLRDNLARKNVLASHSTAIWTLHCSFYWGELIAGNSRSYYVQ